MAAQRAVGRAGLPKDDLAGGLRVGGRRQREQALRHAQVRRAVRGEERLPAWERVLREPLGHFYFPPEAAGEGRIESVQALGRLVRRAPAWRALRPRGVRARKQWPEVFAPLQAARRVLVWVRVLRWAQAPAGQDAMADGRDGLPKEDADEIRLSVLRERARSWREPPAL